MVSFTGNKRKKGEGVHKNDILWRNDDVRYKGKIIYYTKLIKAGIVYLHDIVIGDRFINITELSKKINCPTNMFKLHKLLVAIPDKWKSKVKKKNVCLNEKKSCTIFSVKNNLKHIDILQTKEIYKLLYRLLIQKKRDHWRDPGEGRHLIQVLGHCLIWL